MNIYVIIFIAFALAIDAFAVSLGAGAYFKQTTLRQKFRLSFHFGLFQFLMPIIGWLAGAEISKYIENYDHWIALGILSFIGLNMIRNALKNAEERIDKDITKGLSLISLSIATSIDALAIGFGVGVINESIIFPAIIIGIIAASMSLAGIKLGEILSLKFGKIMEIIGGCILILIGINIVLEHLKLL
jgi:manganese efflux pump family protein